MKQQNHYRGYINLLPINNIRAITGSTKIMNQHSGGGGSKLQGIPSSTNLNT